jgi:hypothetical protein
MEQTNPRREAALLVVVVFLLGMLLGGIAMHVWGERIWGRLYAAPAPMGQPGTMRPVNEVVKEFTNELQLTPGQQTEVTAIINETRSQWQALYVPLEAQHEAIRQEGRARIRALLTPDQLPKFDAFMHKLDERHKREQQAQGQPAH